MRYLFVIVLMLNTNMAMAQHDTTFLKQLLASKPTWFDKVLNHPSHHEVQIMYTQITRDQNNKPTFKSFGYNVNPQHYFYPASTVKLAAVIFALEKVNSLKKKGVHAQLTMQTDSSWNNQTKVLIDQSAQNGKPSVAHYIKKILLTSDNDAFNRLYEFIGRAEINAKLKKYRFTDSRILNRLAIGDGGENARHTNPIRFYDGDELIYEQAAQYDAKDYPLTLNHLLVGKGYLNSKEELVNEPFNFSEKNVFTIPDQQELMKKLIAPEAFARNDRFNLTEEDYKLIYTYMSMLPTESDFPKYSANEFWPTYAKMLYYGREKNVEIDPNLSIFNKYGDSYGYIIDNAYVVDFKNKVEFFLTAVVQGNEDEIYNDNKYDYETICYPFMKNLGKVIYELELNRKKTMLPDLKKYKMNGQK